VDSLLGAKVVVLFCTVSQA